MPRFTAEKLGATAALLLCSLFFVPALYASTISGYAVGSFSNVLDGTGAGSYTVLNNDSTTVARLEWGKLNTNKNPAAEINYFEFDGVGSNIGDPLGTTTLDNLFTMGNFSYYNAPTRQDKIRGTDFTVDIHIAGYGDASLLFNLIMENTRDNSDPLASADTVRIGNMSEFADPFAFAIDGQQFLFYMMGFSRDGGQTFEEIAVSLEGAATSAEIYGRIEAVTPVPLPAGIWFFGSGLLVLMARIRRKRLTIA